MKSVNETYEPLSGFTGVFTGSFPEYKVHHLANIETGVTSEQFAQFTKDGSLKHVACRAAPQIESLYNLCSYCDDTSEGVRKVLAEVEEVEVYPSHTEEDDVHLDNIFNPKRKRRSMTTMHPIKPYASRCVRRRKINFIQPTPTAILKSLRSFYGLRYSDTQLLIIAEEDLKLSRRFLEETIEDTAERFTKRLREFEIYERSFSHKLP
jgi:hypothetical protein